MRLAALVVLFALAGCGGTPQAGNATAQAEATARVSLPGIVLDDAHLLSPADKDTLDARLRETAARTGQRLVVATLPSLKGHSMESVVNDLGNRMGLSDGVMLVIAVKERQIRLAVGHGALKLISNAEAERIVAQDIRPDLHANRFDKGILKGADKILSELSETRA